MCLFISELTVSSGHTHPLLTKHKQAAVTSHAPGVE